MELGRVDLDNASRKPENRMGVLPQMKVLLDIVAQFSFQEIT
jgi:hypothetical protein